MCAGVYTILASAVWERASKPTAAALAYADNDFSNPAASGTGPLARIETARFGFPVIFAPNRTWSLRSRHDLVHCSKVLAAGYPARGGPIHAPLGVHDRTSLGIAESAIGVQQHPLLPLAIDLFDRENCSAVMGGVPPV
jgi:hypothetical protein